MSNQLNLIGTDKQYSILLQMTYNFFCASQPAFEKLLLIQLHFFYSGLETGLASSILEYLYCTT